VACKQIAHGQHIAVKVQGAFGLAGGAAGEGDQAHIVAAAGVRGVSASMTRHALLQSIGGFAAELHHLFQTGGMVGVAGRHAVLQLVGQ